MLKVKLHPYPLQFKFDAGTSRGVLKVKDTHLIRIWNEDNPSVIGIGETGMFRGLSADDDSGYESRLKMILLALASNIPMKKNVLRDNPSINMAWEMANLDLNNGGHRLIYPSQFTEKNIPIPINGLIWMGEKGFMRQQILDKIDQGFDCIKLKIGALDFDVECELLHFIRTEFPKDITLRVDANGAFKTEEALDKLKKLSEYDLHSIEQPIQTNKWEQMAELCEKSPIDIALDEELIGIKDIVTKRNLLQIIKPQYIILKPSLLGGFKNSEEWIDLAHQENIGWWVTSALESNIGLNAIAQWTATLPYQGHQGLGTGGLFHNNITSPLEVKQGMLHYNPDLEWTENIFGDDL